MTQHIKNTPGIKIAASHPEKDGQLRIRGATFFTACRSALSPHIPDSGFSSPAGENGTVWNGHSSGPDSPQLFNAEYAARLLTQISSGQSVFWVCGSEGLPGESACIGLPPSPTRCNGILSRPVFIIAFFGGKQSAYTLYKRLPIHFSRFF